MTVIGVPALQRRLAAIGGTGGNKVMLDKLALSTVREAKLLVPKKTGKLSSSIVIASNNGRQARVAARMGYAAYVEHGTGLYGPSHRKIVPVHAKVLAWRTGQVRLSGRSRTKRGVEQAGWAFAKSVKGRRATPFLLPGARRAVSTAHLADVIVAEWNGAA